MYYSKKCQDSGRAQTWHSGDRRADRCWSRHRRHALFQQVLATRGRPYNVAAVARRPKHTRLLDGLVGERRSRAHRHRPLRVQHEPEGARQGRLLKDPQRRQWRRGPHDYCLGQGRSFWYADIFNDFMIHSRE